MAASVIIPRSGWDRLASFRIVNLLRFPEATPIPDSRRDDMDIQSYAKVFFDMVEQINLQLKAVVNAGTLLCAIDSTGVKNF